MSGTYPGLGNLYFLQVEPDGPIKIGWTSGDVTYRVKALQQSSPHILRWIGACRAPHPDETAAHQELRAHRLRGEWFHPTEVVLAFIARRVGPFDADAYLRKHFRLDLYERLVRVAPPRQRKKLAHILSVAGISTLVHAKWSMQRNLLTTKELARLEAAIDLAEMEAGQ